MLRNETERLRRQIPRSRGADPPDRLEKKPATYYGFRQRSTPSYTSLSVGLDIVVEDSSEPREQLP